LSDTIALERAVEAGDIVRALAPHTEADPAALLLHLLAAMGNFADHDWFTVAEETPHPPKIFVIFVGPSGTGRKGTAWHRILALLDRCPALDGWLGHRVYRGGGLSSGEGLIARVRDERLAPDDQDALRRLAAGLPVDAQWEPPRNRDRDWNRARLREEGRLLTVETEFGRVLRVLQRDGNTLGPIIRQAFDGRHLRVLTKEEAVASLAHITILGHTTRDTLTRLLDDEDLLGGTAPRFLFAAVRRHHLRPDGGAPPASVVDSLVERLNAVCVWLSQPAPPSPLEWDAPAHALWVDVYPALTREIGGTVGVVLNRRDAYAKRLALVYALLDRSTVIREPHLRAALAVLRFAEDSAKFIWGAGLPPEADRVMSALRADGPLTRTQVTALFGKKAPPHLNRTLQDLVEMGRIQIRTEPTGGRPRQVIALGPEEQR
jgi:hypothetical protein